MKRSDRMLDALQSYSALLSVRDAIADVACAEPCLLEADSADEECQCFMEAKAAVNAISNILEKEKEIF